MKISKQLLKRIIREEKQKLQELDLSGSARGSDTEAMLEDAIFRMKEELMGLDIGYNEQEANEVILDAVHIMLGLA